METSFQQPEIILLGFNQNHYGICKNLTDIGLRVTACAKRKSYLRRSRLPYAFMDNLDEIGPTAFLDALLKTGKSLPNHYLLLPATDNELQFLMDNHDALIPYFYLSIPDRNIFPKVTDKYLLQELLTYHGFHYPKTILLDRSLETSGFTIPLSFPVIVKPAFAGAWKCPAASRVIGENKAFIVGSPAELRSLYDKLIPIDSRTIIQEIIAPRECDIYSFCSYSDSHGRVVDGFVTQKLLQYPEGFGTALLCRTVTMPDIYDLGKNVIESLKVDGVCETEIIRDSVSGRLYIIEINTRHWMQHRLSTKQGVNYSLLDYYYRTGDPASALNMPSAKQHQNTQHIWFDDVGYLIYCVKHFFNPKQCKFSEVLDCKWEFSLFSLADWRPFAGYLTEKISQSLSSK